MNAMLASMLHTQPHITSHNNAAQLLDDVYHESSIIFHVSYQGKNDRGQLGIGSRDAHYAPVEVPTPWSTQQSLVKVATGKAHSLFLLSNGEVWGCGAASCGQLGLGGGKRALEDCLVPVHISSLADVRDIACGFEFSVVCTRARGQVLTFGHPEVGTDVCIYRCV